MGYVESLSGFEEHFISGMSQDAELDFYDSNILFLEECFPACRGDSHAGPFWSGEPSLACDCSFYWIVKERAILDVFDRSPGTYRSPRCYDGTFLADLDVEIFDALCPQQGF